MVIFKHSDFKVFLITWDPVSIFDNLFEWYYINTLNISNQTIQTDLLPIYFLVFWQQFTWISTADVNFLNQKCSFPRRIQLQGWNITMTGTKSKIRHRITKYCFSLRKLFVRNCFQCSLFLADEKIMEIIKRL